MARTNDLMVREIVKETSDCVSVAFEVPEDLKETYQFIPGQYLTLRKEIDGEDVRRSYSICSAPYENELRVAIKQVEDGLFSTFANEELKVGDRLNVMKPMGRFISKVEEGQKYVFFAAGSGITPIISIVKDILKNQQDAEVTLFYGNKGLDHIIFRDQISALKNQYMSRFSVHHILSRETMSELIYKGRINEKKCEELSGAGILDVKSADEIFVCGPEPMIHAVKDYVSDHGAEDSIVRFELFTSTAPSLQQKTVVVEEEDSSDSEVTVIVDGIEHNLKLAADGEAILDAANELGADLPFACKGGVCCTCRAKVLEGKVTMDLNYSLEPEEVEQGFVLTCQAHPVSDKVIISFDEV